MNIYHITVQYITNIQLVPKQSSIAQRRDKRSMQCEVQQA